MDKLWQKITSGWHVMRLFYLAGGLMIFIQGIIVHEWPGLLLGGYFTFMGILGTGCVGGQCQR
ncbi:MAG: hypothetical protein U0V49_09090 [Saprospiraceae bacterium]